MSSFREYEEVIASEFVCKNKTFLEIGHESCTHLHHHRGPGQRVCSAVCDQLSCSSTSGSSLHIPSGGFTPTSLHLECTTTSKQYSVYSNS